MPLVSGAKVLDLFAGTGALGFEALSRGASHLTLVEQDRELVDLLQQNQQMLSSSADIIHSDALQFLASNHQSFDLVFLDPPFEKGLISQVCNVIKDSSYLSSNGFLYIESERNLQLPDYLSVHKQKTTGQVQYGLYTFSDD